MFVTQNMPKITAPEEGIVELLPTENGLDVIVHPCGIPLREIRLTWNFDVSPYNRAMRDTWMVSLNDLGWIPREDIRFSPWYFFMTNNEETVCFGVKTGGNSFCAWHINRCEITLAIDIRNGGEGVELTAPLLAATVVSSATIGKETVYETTKRFCRLMCEKPVLPKTPIYGFNTWYYSYGNITRADIMRDADLCALLASGRVNDAPLPYMVIDDGWQMPRTNDYNGGPFIPNNDFADIAAVAEDILAKGCNPGIWVRTMLVRPDLCPQIPESCYSENQEHVSDGPGRILDITTQPAKEYVFSLVRGLVDSGYKLIKHDFSCMDYMGGSLFYSPPLTREGWRPKDHTKTNAQILKEFYLLIEEAAKGSGKDPAVVIGCSTYNHLAAGIHPIQRIGEDTSGWSWNQTRRNGIHCLTYRLCQNDTFFKTDADCACFTEHVPTDKNILFADLIARCNSALFVSAAPNVLTPSDIDRLIEVYRISSAGKTEATPIDWVENPLPSKFRWNDLTISYPWF